MLGGPQADPAVRKPVVELGFGSGASDDWQRSLLSITVEAGLSPNVDVANIVVAADEAAPTADIGDTGDISLGYEDGATETVFTGQIESVTFNLRGTCLMTATNGGAKLSKLRLNQSYEKQKSGDIASDLATRAGVDTDTVEAGSDFPFLVLDDGRNAYQHIAALAAQSGYLAYIGATDLLSFTPFLAGEAVRTFTFGKDIISLNISRVAPPFQSVKVIGAGAAGDNGDEAWSWVVKDASSVTGSAGDGSIERSFTLPSLKSNDAVQCAADGFAEASLRMQMVGELLVPGAPNVSVGCAVEIADAPKSDMNGLCLVREAVHYYNKHDGYLTRIVFSKVDGTGTGGLL